MNKTESATTDGKRSDLNHHNHILDSGAGIIASQIFGTEALNEIFTPSQLNGGELTQKLILQNTNVYIHRELDAIEPSVAACETDTRCGRLGISEVRFDSTSQVGDMLMSADRLNAQSKSNFSTVKANVCFYSGKWQYELQLESKGVMQLGWSMALGEFSRESGVGDTVHSFAYDGNRVRKWNQATTEYGEPWQVGDVIGCTIDLDVGNIHFYRNGRDLGVAFSSIPLGPGCVYYPAISLAFEEKLQANFGSMPFKYPISPYLPSQQAPTGAVLRANRLLHWFDRILSVCCSPSISPQGITEDELPNKEPTQIDILLFCEVLLSHLVSLLSKHYVIETCFVPFLQSIMDNENLSRPGEESIQKLHFLCDVLKFFLEPDDVKELMQAICKYLIQQYNQTSDLQYRKQFTVLKTLVFMCKNSYLRRILLKQQEFLKKRVPQFVDLKPLDTQVLERTVVHTWWGLKNNPVPTTDRDEKKGYLLWCRTITSRTSELQKLQEDFLDLLLNNMDKDEINKATSRQYFLPTFRLFLKDNLQSGLDLNLQSLSTSTEPTPLPVALNYFYCLLSVVIRCWKDSDENESPHVALDLFYNGSIDFFSMERLGGVMSHLITTFRTELVNELGEGHRVFTEPEPQAQPPAQPLGLQIQVTARVDGGAGVTSQVTEWFSLESVQRPAEPLTVEVVPREDQSYMFNDPHLMEILDGVILLYHIAAHKQLYKVSTLRDDMNKYVKTINEAKERLRLAQESCPEVAAEIEASIKVMECKVDEQARVGMAWVQGTIYTEHKRDQLVWLLKAILRTLKKASKAGDLFAFLPEFYLGTMVEICTALRNYFSPTVPLERAKDLPIKNIMSQVGQFLVDLSTDPRVVSLSSKDIIVEALAGFVSKRVTMKCLEDTPLNCQEKFVNMLLKPYDNRPWGQTNWMLMRIWQGCGFAFRYKTPPHLSRKLGPRTPYSEAGLLIYQSFEPHPSKKFQQLIARMLKEDQDMAAQFLNSILKQLNWSFSEFISMMQEIQNLSKKPERVIIDARQLKICATCFEFVISLLRVLEMVCCVCLSVFTDNTRQGTENLLERLSQLLGQILLRVTSRTGCFAHVISLEVPDLDSIDQFPILSSVVGIIVALLAKDLQHTDSITMSAEVRSLLYEPAFQLDTLKYVLGETGQSFSLAHYPQAVSAEELESVKKVVSLLAKHQARMSEAVVEEEEEELCPICCAMPLAVTFTPCQHRSCKSCITHHLMDCKECFFCKTAINTVVANDGTLLFDTASSVHKAAHLNHPL